MSSELGETKRGNNSLTEQDEGIGWTSGEFNVESNNEKEEQYQWNVH